jgi:hypothetical protein
MNNTRPEARIPAMADAHDRDSALDLRASDTDREQVAERLRVAAGQGRLTIDELEERLERAYSAKTYAQLEPITRDLPTTDSAAFGAASARIEPAGRWRSSVAIMSSAARRGAWTVPPRYRAFAFWGAVIVDLREASYAQRETVIRADALMGGIEIIVPDDVEVHIDGVGVMGYYHEVPAPRRPPPGAPVVRVTGICLWAGVQVTRKPAKGLPAH